MRKHFVMQTNTNTQVQVSANSIQSICKLSLTQIASYIYRYICGTASVTIYSCRRPLVVRYVICVFVCFHLFMSMCAGAFVCCMRLLVTCGICSRHIASVRFVTFSLFCRCAFFFYQLTVSKLCNPIEYFFAPTLRLYKHKYSIFFLCQPFLVHAFRRLSMRYVAGTQTQKIHLYPQALYVYTLVVITFCAFIPTTRMCIYHSVCIFNNYLAHFVKQSFLFYITKKKNVKNVCSAYLCIFSHNSS